MEEEEEEESLESDEEEDSEDEEDDEDDSFLASEEEDAMEVGGETALADLSPAELDAKYDELAAALLLKKERGVLTGGQYHFQQTCLDLEFRHLAEVQELRAGKSARAKH